MTEGMLPQQLLAYKRRDQSKTTSFQTSFGLGGGLGVGLGLKTS